MAGSFRHPVMIFPRTGGRKVVCGVYVGVNATVWFLCRKAAPSSAIGLFDFVEMNYHREGLILSHNYLFSK